MRNSQVVWRSREIGSCWPGRHDPAGQFGKTSVGLGTLGQMSVYCSVIKA